jgi:chromosome segregation ATPase
VMVSNKNIGSKMAEPRRPGELVIGGKSFDSPEAVAAYYRAEGQKVRRAMKQFKVDEAQGKLSISKSNFMKIQSQKRKLESIEKDLHAHRDELDKKISDLGSVTKVQTGHNQKVREFSRKMKSLQDAADRLIKTRESLIQDEAKVVRDMKDLAKTAQGDLDIEDLNSIKKLAEFENTKESVLMKARDLLSEDLRVLYADSNIIDDIDKTAHKKLEQLNEKMSNIQGSKKDALEKMHLLEISKEGVAVKLASAEKKVRQLEEKYEKLLKK